MTFQITTCTGEKMILFQKRIQKRRMPEEKIAGYVKIIDFDRDPVIWMPQFEAVLHKILCWEFYLERVPENLSLPKYRAIIVKIVYRMLGQVPGQVLPFCKDIEQPDPLIKEILEYLRRAELRRKEELFQRYPITIQSIRTILVKLKEDLEI